MAWQRWSCAEQALLVFAAVGGACAFTLTGVPAAALLPARRLHVGVFERRAPRGPGAGTAAATPPWRLRRARSLPLRANAGGSSGGEEDEAGAPPVPAGDWRQFRAKLVAQEAVGGAERAC